MRKEKQKKINEAIQAEVVQVIHDTQGNLGEMTFEKALEQAKSEDLDLVEIGSNKDVVIVKMVDYGKLLYRQKKQDQKQKQKGKTAELKTIRITYKIDEHDLQVKRKQAEKFMQDGNPIKVSLMLRGRENNYGDLAQKKMEHFVEILSDIYKLEGSIKRMGNTFHAMLKIIK